MNDIKVILFGMLIVLACQYLALDKISSRLDAIKTLEAPK